MKKSTNHYQQVFRLLQFCECIFSVNWIARDLQFSCYSKYCTWSLESLISFEIQQILSKIMRNFLLLTLIIHNINNNSATRKDFFCRSEIFLFLLQYLKCFTPNFLFDIIFTIPSKRSCNFLFLLVIAILLREHMP